MREIYLVFVHDSYSHHVLIFQGEWKKDEKLSKASKFAALFVSFLFLPDLSGKPRLSGRGWIACRR